MKAFKALAAMGGVLALSACATNGGAVVAAGGGQDGVRLPTGAQYTYVIKDKAKTSFFGQEQVTELTTTMGLNVLSGGRDPTWRWTYSDFTIDAMDLPTEELGPLSLKDFSAMMGPAVRLGTAIGFECKVDSSGGCASLSNWGTWRGAVEDFVMVMESAVKIGIAADAAMKSEAEAPEAGDEVEEDQFPEMGMGEMGPFGGAPDFDQRSVDLVVNILINLLDGIDDRTAGAAAMSGMWGPQGVQGAALRVGPPVDFTRALALPYGGGDLLYKGTRTVESVDRAAGVAMVVSKTELDSVAFKASLLKIYDNLVTPNLKTFAEYSPEDGIAAQAVGAMVRAQMETILSQSTLTFTETTRGTVDLATGLARDTVTEYSMTLKGGGDFDWVEGSLSGTQTITATPGAPTIARLQRRDIAPPPAKPVAEPSAVLIPPQGTAPVATPPAPRRPQPKR